MVIGGQKLIIHKALEDSISNRAFKIQWVQRLRGWHAKCILKQRDFSVQQVPRHLRAVKHRVIEPDQGWVLEGFHKMSGEGPVQLNDRGMELFNQKKFQEALQLFDRALALDPRYGKAWFKKYVSIAPSSEKAEIEDANRMLKILGVIVK